MNRRGFLKTSAAAALALAGAPGLIRRAFADESCAPREQVGLASLAGAYRRAQRAGRPLLVLVIPADLETQWDRGAAWGELLNHGSDDQLAPLSLVDVACARLSDLARLVPRAGGREALAMLVDTARVPAQVTRIDGNLPQYEPADRYRGVDWQALELRESIVSTARIDALGRLLRDALAPNGVAEPAAAAREARARLTDRPPAGAHWARSSGCGTIVEGVNDDSSFGCGMGHVPAKSQRFLTFLARGDRP
jgi:hypothetical protein